MHIIGGSFGVKGDAYITPTKGLVVHGVARSVDYASSDIASMTARTEKEKQFGAIGFILGAIILSVILGMFLSIFGVILAIVIAAAGSFYSKKRHIVDIAFMDGNSVSLECSARAADKLMALRSA